LDFPKNSAKPSLRSNESSFPLT